MYRPAGKAGSSRYFVCHRSGLLICSNSSALVSLRREFTRKLPPQSVEVFRALVPFDMPPLSQHIPIHPSGSFITLICGSPLCRWIDSSLESRVPNHLSSRQPQERLVEKQKKDELGWMDGRRWVRFIFNQQLGVSKWTEVHLTRLSLQTKQDENFNEPPAEKQAR